jgi:predicted RNA-binding protein YlqC (UPF0109 family)
MVQIINKAHNEAEFLEYILRTLITDQEALKIEKQTDEYGVLYIVEIATKDMARVIGHQGKIIKALRAILKSVSYLSGVKATLKINEQ